MALDEHRTVEAVARFFEQHERWPSASSASGYERSLGVWLNRQRLDANTGQLDQFRRRYLDHAIPGWELGPDDAWLNQARDASGFILEHGRRPSLHAEPPGERLLGIWLSSQQSLERIGMLAPDRETWLDEHCPSWRDPAGRAWAAGR